MEGLDFIISETTSAENGSMEDMDVSADNNFDQTGKELANEYNIPPIDNTDENGSNDKGIDDDTEGVNTIAIEYNRDESAPELKDDERKLVENIQECDTEDVETNRNDTSTLDEVESKVPDSLTMDVENVFFAEGENSEQELTDEEIIAGKLGAGMECFEEKAKEFREEEQEQMESDENEERIDAVDKLSDEKKGRQEECTTDIDIYNNETQDRLTTEKNETTADEIDHEENSLEDYKLKENENESAENIEGHDENNANDIMIQDRSATDIDCTKKAEMEKDKIKDLTTEDEKKYELTDEDVISARLESESPAECFDGKPESACKEDKQEIAEPEEIFDQSSDTIVEPSEMVSTNSLEHVDWEKTSLTDEEGIQCEEMQRNGEFDVKDWDIQRSSMDMRVPRISDTPIKIDMPYDINKYSNDEVNEICEQCYMQEDGLNDLSVAQFLENYEKRIQNGRSAEGSSRQKEYREGIIEIEAEKLIENNPNISYDEARATVANMCKNSAVLHNPDQCAGGDPGNVYAMGSKRINGLLGWSWGLNKGAEKLYQEIKDICSNMTEEEKKTTYLNARFDVHEK